jgi:predicted DNA-binding transcriptional regulator YafY
MYSPVTRLMTVLDLLQARPHITAAQLAERLEVNTRSVRRYITMLQDLGLPVEAERGRYGGYRLRPGYKLPPLMWTEDEALAITLGLRAARQLGLAHTVPTVESALAKVERMLPLSVREQVQAIQETVTLNLPISGEQEQRFARNEGAHLAALSAAAYRGARLCLRYQDKSGAETERRFDCYGLLYYNARWYAIGYCHLRQETRVFRLDRITHISVIQETFQRPEHFDCLRYAVQSFLDIPSRWLVEALLDTTLEQVRASVPASFATLEEIPEGILFRAYDDDLLHTARFLIGLGCPFKVLGPPELRPALRELAEGILAAIG